MRDQFSQLEVVESDFEVQSCLALHNEEATDSDV